MDSQKTIHAFLKFCFGSRPAFFLHRFCCFWCGATKGYARYLTFCSGSTRPFSWFCRRRRQVQVLVVLLFLTMAGLARAVSNFVLPDGRLVLIEAVREVYDGQDVEVNIHLSTGEVISTNNTEDDRFAQFTSSLAVWQWLDSDGWEIVWWSGANGMDVLTSNTGDDIHPSTDGRYIVWQQLDGPRWQIYAFDTEGSDGPRLISDPTVTSIQPKVDQGRVVWQAWVGSNWEVMTWNQTEGLVRLTTNAEPDIAPDVAGQYVIWEGLDVEERDRDIFGVDLESQEQKKLTDNVLPDDHAEFDPSGSAQWLTRFEATSMMQMTTDLVDAFAPPDPVVAPPIEPPPLEETPSSLTETEEEQSSVEGETTETTTMIEEPTSSGDSTQAETSEHATDEEIPTSQEQPVETSESEVASPESTQATPSESAPADTPSVVE